MCTATYATPTFITETLHLVTYVQLFSMTVTVNHGLYSAATPASLLLLGWFL